MPTQEKESLINEMTEKLKKAKSVFLTDNLGLTVESVTDLRKRFRESSIEYKVIKNTLLKRSVNGATESGQKGLDALLPFIVGPTGIAIGYDEPTKPAKILIDFTKKNEKLKLKASVVEGQFFTSAQAQELANIPSREILISQLLMILQSPIQNLVSTLNAVLQNFVATVDAIREKKESTTV